MNLSVVAVVAWLAVCSSLASATAQDSSTKVLPPVGYLGGPSRELGPAEAAAWIAGREIFAQEYGANDGIGAPGFNAQSCSTCHQEPAVGGAGGSDFDVLTPRGSSSYVPNQGDTGNQLARLHRIRDALVARDQDVAAIFDVRQTPSLLGLGSIDSIPDDEILKNEDPHDENCDGVRGVASRVKIGNKVEIGRFGWKAEVPRLSDFACRALGGELGLTAPDQGRGFGLAQDDDGVPDPELPQSGLDDLGFFLANLAAPERGEPADLGKVERGELLFERVGCSGCHAPVLYGNKGPVPLYSDLLLHDIFGTKRDDSEPRATAAALVKGQRGGPHDAAAEAAAHMFRTAPLWGIGKTAPYLHDGSAKTLDDAVHAHQGEGTMARRCYEFLSAYDQEALIAFLGTL